MSIANPINPFQPPQKDFDRARSTYFDGSIERAVAGDYDFEIGAVMSEAWALTREFKASFWGAAVGLGAVSFGVGFVTGLLTTIAFGSERSGIVGFLAGVAQSAVLAPFLMGFLMLGIKRARGLEPSAGLVFAYTDKFVPAMIAGLLVPFLTYAGLIALVLPGIYLACAYGMTMPLIADRDLTPWQAMETSRKAVTHKWFRIFGLYLLVMILVTLSALPLLIPLIWTVPWSILVMGVLYRRMFGTASPASAVSH